MRFLTSHAAYWNSCSLTRSKKTTQETDKNFSIPPSQTDMDETRKCSKKIRDMGAAWYSITGENLQKITVEEVSTVEV